MTRKSLGVLAASIAGTTFALCTFAFAADLPTKKGPPPAPVLAPLPISWTGFYASLEGGYAWDGTIVYIGPWNKGFGDTGFFGGGNVGYNYQFGSFVLGAQAEYNIAGIEGDSYAYPYRVTAKVDGFGSVDGRAGVTFGPALVYAIGGFSVGDVRHTISPVWSYVTYAYSSTQTGWDIGGGVEYKFTNNISGFAEFRYYDWGSKHFSDFNYVYHKVDQTLATVRIGLTYSFGGLSAPLAPVIASY
jgi:outer membrane immunogenic protein